MTDLPEWLRRVQPLISNGVSPPQASGTQSPRAAPPVWVSRHPMALHRTAAHTMPLHVLTAPTPASGLSKGRGKRVVILLGDGQHWRKGDGGFDDLLNLDILIGVED